MPSSQSVLTARLMMPNPHGLPRVVIFHKVAKPAPWLLNLFDERTPIGVVSNRERWDSTDLVVYNSGGLSPRRERFANRMGATLVLLPSMEDWIRNWLATRLASGGHDLYLFVAYSGCEAER